jgi:hypothetical protein
MWFIREKGAKPLKTAHRFIRLKSVAAALSTRSEF